MSYLLDTNVLSEWVKPRPNIGVARWLASVDEDSVYLSVVALAELRHGIERLAPGRRRSRLDEWLRVDLVQRFDGRVLAVQQDIADEWGRLVAWREAQGRPMNAMDALVAATAQVQSLTLVTRNVADFTPSLKAVLNPWV